MKNIFKCGLRGKGLHLSGIYNGIIERFKKSANRYLNEKDLDVIKEKFDFNVSIKNWATIEDKINLIA